MARTSSGQRVFSDADLDWLLMLRCLRATGMPIAQMLRFSEFSRTADTIPDRLEVLEDHEETVTQQIAELTAQRDHIRAKIGYYRSL